MSHIIIEVEWTEAHARDMRIWCKNNAIPVVETWLATNYNSLGDPCGERRVYWGNRDIMSQSDLEWHIDAIGEDPIGRAFLLRDRDYTLWKLTFKMPDDRMRTVDKL